MNDSTLESNFFILFKEGDEAGLSYFYTRFYRLYAYRAYRYIGEEPDAQSIAQEAFLRLWILRDRIEDVAHLHRFIERQVSEGGKAYFRAQRNRFHRQLLWFYDYEDPDSLWSGAFEPSTVQTEDNDEERNEQMEAVRELLPHLADEQQLFIRLCLKYDFNYDRIAFYLGGIQEYEVAQRVNKCLSNLKSLLANSRKLSEVTGSRRLQVDKCLSREQAEILELRYELGHSFEEIAVRLGLCSRKVRTLFIQAFTTIKTTHGKNNPHPAHSASYPLQ